MFIKKVHLENYRSHSNTTVEFSKGVNLILGMNGKGKSSILEAISMTLFNLNDRTGKENSGGNYIKYGEKKARVNITFVANDDREYELRTTFSTSKNKSKEDIQKLIDEANIEYTENIKEKLEELCGIKKGFKEIYENIVIAKQNEFINVFKKTGTDREKIFNKIFNTEVYNIMVEGALKIAENKYEKSRDNVSNEIKSISDNMKDRLQLEENLKVEKEKSNEINSKNNKLEKKSEELEKEIKDYENKKNEIEKLRTELTYKQNSIKEKENILVEIKKDKEISENARKKLFENEAQYNEYIEIEKKQQILRENVARLEKEQSLNKDYRHNIETLEIDNKNLNNSIIELEGDISKNESKKDEFKNVILALEQREEALKVELENYREASEKLEELEKEKNEKSNEKLVVETNLKNFENNRNKKLELFENINMNDISKKLSELAKLEDEIKVLRKEEATLETEIRTLNKSMNELSSNLCPYLKENCENLKGKNFKDYFLNQISGKENNLKDYQNKIEDLEKSLSTKYELESKKVEYSNLKSEIENLNSNLEMENQKFKNIEVEIENRVLRTQAILKEKSIESFEILKAKKIEYETELKNLNLVEKRKELENLEMDLSQNYSKISENKSKIAENIKKIEENKVKIILNTDENLSEKRAELGIIESRASLLKKSYEEYLESKSQAEKLETLEETIKKNEEEIEKLKKEEENIIVLGKTLRESLGKIDIEQINLESENIKKELGALKIEIGQNNEKINAYQKDLEEIKNKEDKIKELEKELRKVETKFNKTKAIRNNVKEMGRAISKYMLEEISNIASINFNKITGRTERIKWSNEDKDKYSVYLESQDRETYFDQISGGEQVSVAIAIRGAMTNYFTNSKFMILDEPTNNLDIEKRKLLSEYIGEILKDLDQTIVVTHDDTFREMAERIIEL